MKKICFMFGILLLGTLSAFGARFNVKSFGAAGDGVADDTIAIQKALLNASYSETFALICTMGGSFGCGWGGEGAFNEVYFPAGTYKITRPLVYPGPNSQSRKISLRGEKGAVIVQSDPKADLFFLNNVFRLMVRSLVLRGGKTQLQVWTANSDTAMVHLDGCRFEGSSDTAIVCRIPVENKVLKAPYQVSWISQAVPRLTPVPAEPGRSEFWNSTLFDIENCDFSNCARVMDLSCDLAVIRNSRIATPKAQKGPVFLLMNQVYFRNVKGMGSGSKTDSPYWIDISATVENKALLYVDECEFDVKGADGWCLVKSNLKPGYISTAIRVADSRIRSAGCPEGGIVSLAAGTSPNLIAIRNVTDPSGRAVRAVSYGKPLSKDDFLNRLSYLHYRNFGCDLTFGFCVSGCSDNIDPGLTPGARDFLNPPLPEKIAASAKVKPVEFSFDPDAVFAKRIDAGKYGVTGKGKDESAAVEAALAAAAKEAPVTLVFPSANIQIGRTLSIPDNIRLSSYGNSLFLAPKDFPGPLFRIQGNRRNVWEGIGFAGGRNAVEIKAAPDGEYLFDFCLFTDQSSASVLARAAKKGDESKLKIGRSRFLGTMCAFDADLTRKEIEKNWCMNDGRMHDAGLFVNRGGELLFQYNLLVPILPKTKIGNGREDIGKFQEKQWGVNARWIDNHGRIYCFGNRFGGEFMGMTTLCNFSPDGSVMISGGFSQHANRYCRLAFLHAAALPKMLVLEDFVCGAEGLAFGNRSGISRRDSKGKEVYGSGNMRVFTSNVIHQAPEE